MTDPALEGGNCDTGAFHLNHELDFLGLTLRTVRMLLVSPAPALAPVVVAVAPEAPEVSCKVMVVLCDMRDIVG